MQGRELTKKDKYFLHKAMGLGLAFANNERHNHAAIVVKKGKILSWGVNFRKNHPSICVDPLTESGQHAEISAIKKANTNLNGASIYIARVNKDGKPLLSKPCKACESAIMRQGIRKVFYTE